MSFGFQRVIAWQKAHEFVLSVYRITKRFPEDERTINSYCEGIINNKATANDKL